jgi:hypothetical protein
VGINCPLLLALDKLPDKDGLIMQAQQKARPTQLLYRYSYLKERHCEERAGEAIRNSCAMGWIAAIDDVHPPPCMRASNSGVG